MSTEAAGEPRDFRPHPFWLGAPGRELFGWLYQPTPEHARNTGVLLCPSIGHEYVHAHRSYRHLAEHLHARGYTVLRLDYLGTGNSAGAQRDRTSLRDWLEDLHVMAQLLRDQPGVQRIALFGVRLGGLLVAEYAALHPVDDLLLWNPVQRGRAWRRELNALAQFALRPVDPAGDVVEAAGFPFGRSLVEQLDACQMAELKPRLLGGALFLQDEESAIPACMLAWTARGIACEARAVPGFTDMLAEPHYTQVPHVAIHAIGEWLDGRAVASVHLMPEPIPQALRTTVRFDQFTEQCLQDEGVPFSIETRPLDHAQSRMPLLLLCNSGSVHHVGPNRVYVELARHLARRGAIVVRLDLGNLGDSAIGTAPDENHPYAATAADQALASARAARARHPDRPLVVSGLRSGAHTAFHAALRDSEGLFAGLLMINPLTFYWHPALSLDIPHAHRTAHDKKYYERAILRGSSWRKLLRGEANYRYLARFLFSYAREWVRSATRSALEALGVVPRSRLAQDLLALSARKRVAFVFSDTDPGQAILQADGGLAVRRMLRRGTIATRVVNEADHTFSQGHARAQLLDAFDELLAGEFDPPGPPE